MARTIIELHCQRTPKETVYSGELVLRSEPGATPVQGLNLPFSGKELQDVAVWLHHLVRLMADSGTEFCVRMFQKAPNSPRPAVAMDLEPAQVNRIYQSVEAAQIFFAPRERVRKIGPTGTVK